MNDPHIRGPLVGAIVSLAVIGAYATATQQPVKPAATRTKVVLLGTGSPRPEPTRSGPATAIVVGDTPYLVDVGPGIVRRAQAAFEKGIKGLAVANLGKDNPSSKHLSSCGRGQVAVKSKIARFDALPCRPLA